MKPALLSRILLTFLALIRIQLIAAEDLRIATFNCEFLIRSKCHIKFGLPFNLQGADRQQWDQPGFRDARFREACEAVAGVVTAIDADIICLVEVGDESDVTEFRQMVRDAGLDYQHQAVCDSQDPTTGQHVAVLSKRPLVLHNRVIPGRETYDGELDDPETENDTGVSKGMHVSIAAANKTVHLFVVHLASERGGHEQDAQRIAQASIVRRNYLDLLNKGELVIVAGDLNDHRGQPTLRRIRGRDDIYADLIQTGNGEFFPDHKLDTRWTYEFQGVRQQIDHILISETVKDACRRNNGVLSETLAVNERLASDHRPFIVTLRFKD